MVILGGLELVAAGYLIHKHQENKKNKQRLEDEAAELEEQQYRIFPEDGRHPSSQHRHRRSSSRDRRDRRDDHHRRRHSADGKYRREDARPESRREDARPPYRRDSLMSGPPHVPSPAQGPPPSAMPPPYSAVVPPMVAQQAPPQDVKYGWTDDQPADGPSQQPNGAYPPTGWPAHWAQSQTPPAPAPVPANSGARLQAPKQHSRRGENSRGRSEGRASSASPHPHVRFAEPSVSPPPSYRSMR